MKQYGLPKAPPRRRVARLERPQGPSSLERTRGMASSDRSFDPRKRGSWRGSSRDLVVNGRSRMKRNATERELEEFLNGYLVTMLWSSTDESDERGGEPLDANYSVDDIDPESIATARKVCAKFLSEFGKVIDSAELTRESDDGKYFSAGHDFWLTRNGHGAGFWDGDWSEPEATILSDGSKAFGSADPYVGDDGSIYISDGFKGMRANPQHGDDDVPHHVEPINFRYSDPPDHSGRSIRYGEFQGGTKDSDEAYQWYEVEQAGGYNRSGTVNKANYNTLRDMLEEAHPRGSEPAVWATARGDMGTFAIIVVWSLLDDDIKETIGALEDYPLIDDSEHSRLQAEAEEEAWNDWAQREFENGLVAVLDSELSEEGDEEFELPDDFDSFELFRIGCNVSQNFFSEESDGGLFIRMRPVVDAAVDVLLDRESLVGPGRSGWIDPDQKKLIKELREELGIEVK